MLLCFIYHVFMSRSRLCHALCPLWACAFQSLGPFPCVIASVPPMAYLGVTTCEIQHRGVGLLDADPFSALCDVMLALLALCYPFVFLCFFAFLHSHVHAWVCVSSLLQSYGTRDTWSKPTFVLLGHPLLFDNMFVYLIWLIFIACLLACFPFSCFVTCLLACFLCHCMYMRSAWTLGERTRPPRRKQKGQGYKQEDISPQRAMFSRLGGLASSHSIFPRAMH